MRKSAAESPAGTAWNQITLPVLLMISGPLTEPPSGVMKMSPLPLSAPCLSTMTAGGVLVRPAATGPDDAAVHAVPAKAMTAATTMTAATPPACRGRPSRLSAARNEKAISAITHLRRSGKLPSW